MESFDASGEITIVKKRNVKPKKIYFPHNFYTVSFPDRLYLNLLYDAKGFSKRNVEKINK